MRAYKVIAWILEREKGFDIRSWVKNGPAFTRLKLIVQNINNKSLQSFTCKLQDNHHNQYKNQNEPVNTRFLIKQVKNKIILDSENN